MTEIVVDSPGAKIISLGVVVSFCPAPPMLFFNRENLFEVGQEPECVMRFGDDECLCLVPNTLNEVFFPVSPCDLK